MEPSRNKLARVNPIVSHWLGYRPHPPKPLPAYAISVWSFIAAFCGLSVLQAIFRASYFVRRAVPSVIASYGASAVLIFGTVESPLAQPRALLGGHFIGAVLGTCISKLFQLLPSERYASLNWLAGSLAVAVSMVAMQLTGTVHPPAGATALLAAVDADVIELSWYFLPVVLLSSTMVLVVALLVNNVQRRYPVFWWAPNTPAPSSPVLLNEHANGNGHIPKDSCEGTPYSSSEASGKVTEHV